VGDGGGKLWATRVESWGDDVGKFVGDGTTPRHTRPRSGIQVSAADAVGFTKYGLAQSPRAMDPQSSWG